MKILAAGDIHGDLTAAKKLAEKAEKENVDLIILNGDFTLFEEHTPGLIQIFKDKGIRYDKFTFVSVGRLVKGKNQEIIIKAFKKLNLDIDLILIGDGSQRDKLNKLIKKLHLEKNIQLVGKDNPFKYLKYADCFIFASNYESFGNVLLEALACNLPIISTDCRSGPREILAPNTSINLQTDGIEIAEFGILTKVDDIDELSKAMKLMYEDSKLRYNFKQKAKERILDFDVKKIVKEWERLISG